VISELKADAELYPGDHVCWTYASDQEHREVLTRFLAQGLERNERVLYLGHRYDEETVLGYLQEAGVADEDFRRLGQLVVQDIHRALQGDGSFPSKGGGQVLEQAATRAVADGHRGLRVASESGSVAPALLSAAALLEHELWATPMVVRAPLTALCGYDARFCQPDWLLAVQAVHPLRVTGSSVRPSPFRVGSGNCGETVLEGKVDWRCRAAFRLALQAAAVCGPAELVVDLAGLEFIDLSGLRVLVELCQELNSKRRSLILRSPPEVVRRIMHPSLGFDPPSNLHLS
jgi:anti-anti-sigma factor